MKILIILLLVFISISIFLEYSKYSGYSGYSEYSEYSEYYNIGKQELEKYSDKTNLAVMFDIDDTLFDSITHQRINEIIDLLLLSKSMGYKVIIITARSMKIENQTKDLLNTNNIPYDYLFMHIDNTPYQGFKSEIKKQLFINEFIKIILSVGDNIIDIEGEYSGLRIKLPNK